MDSLRGQYPDRSDSAYEADHGEDDTGRELPPAIIGQDERRMQVRAYNFWAGLLGDKTFPSIEDLDPDALPDFGPHSVLLDFSAGMENPAIRFVGDKLAAECETDDSIESLNDVPARSLLSRITDHYMQILANQAPIGFEAEFVNQRGATILYRGILLPFSSDDDTIDFIYGVINWKEMADEQTTNDLLREIDQALEVGPAPVRNVGPLTEWADGPAESSDVLDLSLAAIEPDNDTDWPAPAFGLTAPTEDMPGNDWAPEEDAAAADDDILDLVTLADDGDLGLADLLASARTLAEAARGSEDRSRQTLYAAIGRAHDFAVAALADPEDYREIVADAGLTLQDRAPLTPLVKLVFGADYDKTRLTEFAAALGHARRLELGSGTLAAHLAATPGGLKAVVAAERALRRAEAGKPAGKRDGPRSAIARKLRQLDPVALTDLPVEGEEFTLLIARRAPDGTVCLIGEVAGDTVLLERAAKHLIG